MEFYVKLLTETSAESEHMEMNLDRLKMAHHINQADLAPFVILETEFCTQNWEQSILQYLIFDA